MEKTAEEVIEDLDGKILSKLDIDANGRLHRMEFEMILILAKEVSKLKQELTNIKGTSHGGH